MTKSKFLNVLFSAIAGFAIVSGPTLAFAQHGGHMGGGGFHGGGFHGGPVGGFRGPVVAGGFHGPHGPVVAGGFHGPHGPVFVGGVHGPVVVHGGGFWGYPWGFGFGVGVGFGLGFGWGPYPAPYPYAYYPYYPYPYPYLYYPAPSYPPACPSPGSSSCPNSPVSYPSNGGDSNQGAGYSPSPGAGHSGLEPGSGMEASPSPALRYASEVRTRSVADYQPVDAGLRQLSPERQRIMQNMIRALRAMPPDARQRQIDSGLKNFSPEERKLLQKAALLPRARVQPSERIPRPRSRSPLADVARTEIP